MIRGLRNRSNVIFEDNKKSIEKRPVHMSESCVFAGTSQRIAVVVIIKKQKGPF